MKNHLFRLIPIFEFIIFHCVIVSLKKKKKENKTNDLISHKILNTAVQSTANVTSLVNALGWRSTSFTFQSDRKKKGT